MLPFDRGQFLDLFAAYNTAIHPAGLAAYLLGGIAVVLTFSAWRKRGPVIFLILAVMWIWTGIVYHGLFFIQINSAAPLFAAIFVLQGVALVHAALKCGNVSFRPAKDLPALFGAFLVLYSMVFYPLLGMLYGEPYPAAPAFGVTPCPVVLFTFGFLFMAEPPFPKRLGILPLLWAAIGGSAAVLLDMPQDWLLLVLFPVASLLLVRSAGDRRSVR
jgi:hypothetical protein